MRYSRKNTRYSVVLGAPRSSIRYIFLARLVVELFRDKSRNETVGLTEERVKWRAMRESRLPHVDNILKGIRRELTALPSGSSVIKC